jgi:hypothetical protein
VGWPVSCNEINAKGNLAIRNPSGLPGFLINEQKGKYYV